MAPLIGAALSGAGVVEVTDEHRLKRA